MTLDSQSNEARDSGLLRLSADVVSAYLSRNQVPPQAIPGLIRTVHETFNGLDGTEVAPKAMERRKPAVPISRSIHDDYIICLEDGKKLKMLKRYLRARYEMTPEEYRRRWGLPADYPMVAPAYAARRSDFAKQIGLGKGVRRR